MLFFIVLLVNGALLAYTFKYGITFYRYTRTLDDYFRSYVPYLVFCITGVITIIHVVELIISPLTSPNFPLKDSITVDLCVVVILAVYQITCGSVSKTTDEVHYLATDYTDVVLAVRAYNKYIYGNLAILSISLLYVGWIS